MIEKPYQIVVNKKVIALLGLFIVCVNIIFLALVMAVLNRFAMTIDITDDFSVILSEQMQIKAQINESFDIPFKQALAVPLDIKMDVPFSADVVVNDSITVDMSVPIEMNLSEKELKLSYLEVPIDTNIMIDEVFLIDTVVPIDTSVKTYGGIPIKVQADMPVKFELPLNQSVHIKKLLKVELNKLAMKLDIDVPIKTKININQPVHTRGMIPVHLRQEIKIPINQTIPVKINKDINTIVDIDESVPVKMGQIVIDYQSIGLKQISDSE